MRTSASTDDLAYDGPNANAYTSIAVITDAYSSTDASTDAIMHACDGAGTNASA